MAEPKATRSKPAGRRLREGFSTGTAAAAAAKAATLFTLGCAVPQRLDTPLPGSGRLAVPISSCRAEAQGGARAAVVKDGGDDPDATHGAAIEAVVRLVPGGSSLDVRILGGSGVGVATLPGLPVAVGAPAINPAPRCQIEAAVREAAAGFRGCVEVTVEVPDGAAIAARTMNPRLGITGGISILGTTGIVRPLSHEAWRAAVDQALSVARAAGLAFVVLTTGRTSERLYLKHFPATPPLAVVQAGDHFAHALGSAGRQGFARITLAVFFGKLLKQAQGLGDTHASRGRIDFARLAETCRAAGLSRAAAGEVGRANTASQALEVLLAAPRGGAAIRAVLGRALGSARGFAGPGPELSCLLFHRGGRLIAQGADGQEKS